MDVPECPICKEPVFPGEGAYQDGKVVHENCKIESEEVKE